MVANEQAGDVIKGDCAVTLVPFSDTGFGEIQLDFFFFLVLDQLDFYNDKKSYTKIVRRNAIVANVKNNYKWNVLVTFSFTANSFYFVICNNQNGVQSNVT